MYVPPDEAVQEQGEINMIFEGDNPPKIVTDPGVSAAINPIYQR